MSGMVHAFTGISHPSTSVSRTPDWQSTNTKDWQIATAREAIIRPLAELPRVTVKAADEAAHLLGISRSLVYELIARFRRRPQTSSLLRGKRGLKPQSTLLAPSVHKLIMEAIQEFYLQRERPRFADLMREIRTRCHQQGYPMPNFRSVKKRLVLIDAKAQVQRRFGAATAREQFAPVRTNTHQADLPLERVQIDHTPVDVIVLSERDRKPIGRPWLTLAIDVASRTIMGFAVLLEPPSTISVALTLTHAVMSKDAWLADRELEVRWPVHGIPDLLHLDNASEFHSQALERGAEEYGVRLDFRPPGAPHYGGHIERLIGTTMGAVHLLPGTTFSNVAEKGDYDSESAACLTLLELERWLALQITGVYHQAVHSVLGRPPIVAWQEGLALRRRPPRLPADPETFFLDFLPGETRLIRRDGIQFSHIFYWDNILSPLAGRSPEPVLIKYDPRNLERIYFLDANGRYWPIPYRDLGLLRSASGSTKRRSNNSAQTGDGLWTKR